jgi:hypothetical protein
VKKILLFLTMALCLVFSQVANAATTKWMTIGEARSYQSSVMKKSFYASKIECRLDKNDKILLRLHIKPIIESTRTFYKWQFIVARRNKLRSEISAIPLTDRPDLKYKTVSTSNVGGWSCAVIHR